MTDKSSASASEILAGALQDFNRAVIVGDSSTFGKGTVQQPMDIGRMLPLFAARNRAGYLKVTIQKFYRPSGSSTQMDGVAANVVVPSSGRCPGYGRGIPGPPSAARPDPPGSGLQAISTIQSLFIPRLKELSEQRLNSSKDFSYIIQDVLKAKDPLEGEQAFAEQDAAGKGAGRIRYDAEGAECRTPRPVHQDGRGRQEIDGLLQDHSGSTSRREPISKPYNPADETGAYMRRAKDETAELDETPKWPTGLDPVKRESLAVLKDLVELTENARLAGMLKSEVR